MLHLQRTNCSQGCNTIQIPQRTQANCLNYERSGKQNSEGHKLDEIRQGKCLGTIEKWEREELVAHSANITSNNGKQETQW